MWERTAEDNALDHLQKVGLIAPLGDVDKILQTVVNNLILTNNLEIIPDVRCRVLLTSPLESFTVGHTIVISRGLLDVLPDEASLAMTLAHELSHIALGHRIDTRFAFNDRFFFPDTSTFQRMDFARNICRGRSCRYQSNAVAGELSLQRQVKQRRPFPGGAAESRTGTS